MIIAAEGFELRSRSSNAHYWEQDVYPRWTALRCYQHFPDGAAGTGVEPHYHGTLAPPPDFRRPRFTSRALGAFHFAADCDELWLFTSGTGEVWIDGQRHDITPNTLVYTPMGSEHRFQMFTPYENVRRRTSSCPCFSCAQTSYVLTARVRPNRTRSSRVWSGSAGQLTLLSAMTVRPTQPYLALSCLAKRTADRSTIPARAARCLSGGRSLQPMARRLHRWQRSSPTSTGWCCRARWKSSWSGEWSRRGWRARTVRHHSMRRQLLP